nr:TerD family protein [Oscillospiraceae bacterium]
MRNDRLVRRVVREAMGCQSGGIRTPRIIAPMSTSTIDSMFGMNAMGANGLPLVMGSVGCNDIGSMYGYGNASRIMPPIDTGTALLLGVAAGGMMGNMSSGQGLLESMQNQNQYNTPQQNRYGAPQNQYGAPQNQYGAPQNQYGAPQNQYGAPQNQYGAQQNQYGAQQNQYGAQQNQYGAPQNQYGAPQNQYGAPQNQYGAPQNQYGAPQNRYGAQQNQYNAPQNQYGTQQDQYGTQPQRYGIQPEQPVNNDLPARTLPPVNGNIVRPDEYMQSNARPAMNNQPVASPRPAANIRSAATPAPAANIPQSPPRIHRNRVPVRGTPLVRGQKWSVADRNGNMPSSLKICVGWDISDSRVQLDASAFMLRENGNVPGEEWFIFYSQTESPDRSVSYRSNDQNPNAPDDAEMYIDLRKVSSD